jgi:hypothetical protein
MLAFATAFVIVPESTRRATGRLDLLGAALLGCAVIGSLLVPDRNHDGWASPWAPALLIAGFLAALVWWRHERRRPDPLVEVRVLAGRPVLLTNVVTFLLGLRLFGAFSLIPIIVQAARRAGGLVSGRARRPAHAPDRGRHVRFRAAGRCCHPAKRCAALAAGAAVMGIGFGALSASAPNLIVAAVHQLETGAQTGVNTMVQNLGTSTGSQLSVVVLASAGVGVGGAIPSCREGLCSCPAR